MLTLDAYVGKRGIFRPKSYGEWYWGDEESAEAAEKYDGKEFEITSVEVDNGDFEDSYFNIKFDDGYELDGISSQEFDMLKEEE